MVDGVFSMEGDLADLPAICRLAKAYGARVMVDDAHGLGVLGRNGRGTAEYFGVEDQVDVVMGTFSKSFASLGGFMTALDSACHYVQHFSRPLIFSASMPPAAVAATMKALEIIETEPERRTHLLAMAARLRDGLRNLGFDVGNSITPVVPVVIGPDEDGLRGLQELLEHGVYANPGDQPGHPAGTGPDPDEPLGHAYAGTGRPRSGGLRDGRPGVGPDRRLRDRFLMAKATAPSQLREKWRSLVRNPWMRRSCIMAMVVKSVKEMEGFIHVFKSKFPGPF